MKFYQDELVSVIIPYFNEVEYFDECIHSVLNQTYRNLEILVINDCSSEENTQKLLNYQKKYSAKVFIYHNQFNQGVGASRNLGISKAKGKYISFIDADDYWVPEKIETQISLIKKNNLKFIHNSYWLIDDNEKIKGKHLARDLDYEDLLKSCDIGLSTVTLTADLAKNNLFPSLSTKEDYVCWLKIVKKLGILHGDAKVLVQYRDKKKSLSKNTLIKVINAYKVYSIYEKNFFLKSLYYTLRLSFNYLIKVRNISNRFLYPINFVYIKNFDKISFEKSFIFVALNMACLSYMNLLYANNENIIFWLDGLFGKFIIKDFLKTPGRKVIEKITITKDIENVYLCGNYSKNQIDYLEIKFKRKIIFLEIPFFKKFNQIKKFNYDFKNNSLIVLNISTPKQEIVAKNILKKNPKKKIFIFCLGGGLAMASGDEKVVPDNIEKMNLEWMWRLKENTFFRLKRLIKTCFVFFLKKIIRYFDNIKFKELI